MKVYEVWMTQGQGGFLVEAFKTKEEAEDLVKKSEGQGSFMIKEENIEDDTASS